MERRYCLNCTVEIDNQKFCGQCGQKTDTHRIKMKHFILHDLLHGVWHFEKGILFTVKEVFKRPGKAALDYIAGKRIRYYNVFYLSLLLIGVNILLVHFYRELNADEHIKPEDTLTVVAFLSKYINFIICGMVHPLAFNAWIIFKRLNLNFAEHLIIGGINLVGILFLSIFYKFFDFANDYFSLPLPLAIFEPISFVLMILFPAWTYYNAARKLYSWGGFVWRIAVFYIVTIILLFALLTAVILMLTDNPAIEINL